MLRCVYETMGYSQIDLGSTRSFRGLGSLSIRLALEGLGFLVDCSTIAPNAQLRRITYAAVFFLCAVIVPILDLLHDLDRLLQGSKSY